MTALEAFAAEPRAGDEARLQAAELARFHFDPRGRMLAENAPDRSDAPLLALSGCGHGNRLALRRDVPDPIADRLARLVAVEPPLARSDQPPLHSCSYLAILGEAFAGVLQPRLGLNFVLPHELPVPFGLQLLRSGEVAGEALRERFAREGMPPDLVAHGFVDVHELWPPWCAVMMDGAIAALAFCARLGTGGAHAGLFTLPPWRGRGLGTAATAAWSAHPELASRPLFYSCAADNRSSQRVVQRLALRMLGTSFTVVAPPRTASPT